MGENMTRKMNLKEFNELTTAQMLDVLSRPPVQDQADLAPEDNFLIQLYRQYSQEYWAAGWIDSPAEHKEHFTRFLVDRFDGAYAPTQYEIDGLPALREIYATAQAKATRRAEKKAAKAEQEHQC